MTPPASPAETLPRSAAGGTAELLSRLQRLDVRLWVEDGRLRFSAPKGALAPELKAEMVERKAEILAFLDRAQGGPAGGRPPIVATPREAGSPVPLSFAQQRLWFLDRFDPGSVAYNLPDAERLVGKLDVGALVASFREIVRRHEVLRTTFGAADGRPVQTIAPRVAPPLPVVDLGRLPEVPRERETRRLAAAEARRPFDLTAGPLLRMALLRLGDEEHVVLFTMHHIVSDAWSMGIFRVELMTLYRHHSGPARSGTVLPMLPVQYADFSAWQRQWLSGEVLEAECAHWEKTLAGAPPVLELPTDRPHPARRGFAGSSLPAALPEGLARDLADLARRHQATLFMVLLAAYKVLLCRLSGQRDVVVGSPIAGRHVDGIEGLIGFFVNTLVLRSDLSGRPGFGELLARVRHGALDAYAHQDLPFEKLVERLHPQRDAGRNPIVQVAFALHNVDMPELDLPGLALRRLERRAETAVFDLGLSLEERGAGVAGQWQYSTELFDATTVRRLRRHFETLLAAVVAEEDRSIWELPLLDDAERHQLRSEWNDSGLAVDASVPVHRLFEAVAAARPEATAVVFEDRTVSYGELDRRSARIAAALRVRGVGPSVPVGLFVDRSPEMVAAILAVWKAGGAFLPLDVDSPAPRLATILEDAFTGVGSPVVVTEERFADALPDGVAAALVDDLLRERVPGADQSRRDAGAPSADRGGPATAEVAYLIYTSGTTGRPKAVAVAHSGLSNVLQTSLREMGWDADDRMPVLAAYTFDIFLFELLCPLLSGGTAEVFERRPALDVDRLASFAAGFTRLHAVPALMRQVLELLAARGDAAPGRLRTVLVGGDAVPDALLADLLEAFPAAEVRELYGPTEGTIICSSYPVPRGARPVRSLIGRPLGNARLRLLGDHGSMPPLGSAGEIVIGGAAVARGYLHREELTRERFVTLEDERWYRTGDLARYLPSGDLEFLGRSDHQVKVRGFRVELGEIETVLAGHRQVFEAVVLARDERLVAFVTLAPLRGDVVPADSVTVPADSVTMPADSAAPSAGDLRAFARARLPDYMVPSAVVTLDAWPLLPNGKVDRAALGRLAVPDLGIGRSSAYTAPRGPVEEVLAGIWAEVLAREGPDGDAIGADDDFFELGGHSLLATRVISRVRQAFGVEVPVRALFEAPTVAGLARTVERALGAGEPAETPPIVPAERGGPLPGLPGSRVAGPLSFAQQRLWFLDRLEPGSPLYNLPVASRFEELEVGVLARALAEVVRRHEALRTVFRRSGEEPAQVIVPAGEVALPVVDLARLAAADREAEARHLALAEARRPFDLEHGPLLRASVLRLGPSSHTVLLDMHHIVSDGWSMTILESEARALYDAFSRDEPSPLSELTVQYADYAHWQRRWLDDERLAGAIAYWRRRLAAAAVLELPTDRPRPPVQSHRGATRARRLPGPLSGAVRRFALERGATPFMTLLAAFQVLLARASGQEDVSVGTPVAGRDRLETEGLIGFFVNTLVLRTDLAGEPGFGDVVGRVREGLLEAHGNQDLPFEKLVEELEPERSLSTSPLFQVMFSVAEAADASSPAADVSDPLASGETKTAKFDLDLTVVESPQGTSCRLEYATALFDAATAERLLRRFEALVAAAAQGVEGSIWELPLLAPAERHQLEAEWNDSGIAVDASVPAHRLFEAVAAARPEATAIVFETQALSYGELDRRASRLAGALRARGVGPSVPVGLFVERSPEMVAAILGVWKAGGAFLPLDVDSPAPRLEMILEDAFTGVESPVVVTEERFADALPDGVETALVDDLLRERAPGADQSRGDAGAPSADRGGPLPAEAAYLIYTSGTTGLPKAVAVGHASLSNVLRASLREMGWDAADRMPVLAAYTFDVFLLELLCPLLAGGTAIVFGRRPALDLELLASSAADFTRLHAVPALMRQLLELLAARGDGGRLRRLRTALVGGDAVPDALLADLTEAFPAAEIRELYGPTEGTIICSSYPVPRGAARPARSLLGRPLANVRLRLFGRHGAAVPLGAAGEIAIGGAAPALGYLHRDELTGERFVTVAGERWYRTGDLARYLPSGDLEFLGRTDHQVKVRGFRVELGEIETVLAGHPQVLEAVVLAREGRLAAFVVPAGAAVPSSSGLRAFLRQKLPDYMVPSSVVSFESWPLLPNGKVDRAALGRLAVPEPASGRSRFGAPRGPIEEVLAGIWSEVLEGEDPASAAVGARDDFFELGGHSLLATRVISRVRQAFGVEVPVRALFEAPTVAGLARAIERALGAGEVVEAPPIVPVERGGPLPDLPGSQVAGPLSFAQQRLWFLDRLEPGSPAYNLAVASRFDALEVGALARALRQVVRRHEGLRTVFRPSEEGEPVQVVLPAAAVALPVVDLGSLSAADRANEEERLAEAEARRPFDLVRGPLLRASVLRLGAAAHTVLFNMHHIVSDGWSMTILVRELGVLYRGYQDGSPQPLPDLPVQYADFAHWQRQWLRGEVMTAELDYWRGQLAGAPPYLELPTDRPRSALSSHRGASRELRLPESLARELRELGRRRGLTLFMTLLAAFQALLARYTGRTDILVGTPIAGRGRLEIEDLIGFFVNTLVTRAVLAGDPVCGEILARVREVVLEAHAHQDLPFEKLVEELRPERSLSHTPLFQVMFAFDSVASHELPADDPEAPRRTPIALASGTAKFDLSLSVVEEAERLSAWLEYSADLFDETTAERMLRHFRAALSGILADPDRRLSGVPLLTPSERQMLLWEWQDTDLPCGELGAVHHWVERWAERTPSAVAVALGGGRLSYGELDRRANRMARFLRRRGVGADTVVGLPADGSVERLVGLLAILKAGGAYLPLDPANPPERLAFMLEDSAVALVLGRRERLPELPARLFPALRFLDPATDRPAIASESPENPGGIGCPEDLAYTIYTSGSTGQPKGVLVAHRGLARHGFAASRSYGLGPGDRVLQFAPLTFDVAAEELYPTWLAGGTVVLWQRTAAPTVGDFLRFAEVEGLTVANLPTPFWQEWVSELEGADAPALPGRLRLVIVGSDTVTPRAYAAWRRLVGNRLAWRNAYGVTEATVTSAIYAPSGGEHREPPAVPIGRPIGGVRLHLLDRRLGPVPLGATGELCAAGPGVARGYHRRSALTAERFIPDPYAGRPGTRLYRSGDLARNLADGHLTFLGRRDTQVKLRGLRIELGEIEAVLAEHPRVREAVVPAGEGRLLAYVTLARRDGAVTGSSPPSSGDLRDFLRRKLPGYMVPSAVVVLETLPLMPNGKVDRAALRRLLVPESEAGRSFFVAPRGPVEEVLAGIWSEVLEGAGAAGAAVGARDDFFELGGHSLLATRLISRVRQAFGVEVPVRALFEAPTVAGLARTIERALGAGEAMEAPPIVPLERGGPLPGLPGSRVVGPLSFAQQRLWFLDRLEPGSPLYNLPAATRFGELAVEVLARALAEVVRRHEALRTVFRTTESGEAVQVIEPPGAVSLPVVDLAGLSAGDRQIEERRLARAEARRPFDLEHGPLLRASVLRLGASSHTVLLNMHHIVSDGWSMTILEAEARALYDAYSRDEPSPLSELDVQYADFAQWQRRWLDDERLAAALAYWRRRLEGAAVLELPTDRPRPPVRSHRGAAFTRRLRGDLAGAVPRLALRRGATPFMTLLAAFQVLLARASGQEDVSVGTPIAGRDRLEVEGLIGFFVNTLVLRVDLSGEPGFGDVVARAREALLEAHAHQDLPFEKLVEELEPERSLSTSPLFQVMFSVAQASDPDAAAVDVSDLLASGETKTAKFDLSLSVVEGPGALTCWLEIATALFDAATGERLLRQFEALLAAVALEAEGSIWGLPLLGAAERHQIATEWNDTGVAVDASVPAHRLFEAVAASRPEATAVVFEDRTLSYGELDRASGKIAAALHARGVGPSTPVGLFVERSPEMVAAILGVWKAGGAFLPLDVDSPAPRLAMITGDAFAGVEDPVVVTEDRFADLLPDGVRAARLGELLREGAPGAEQRRRDAGAPGADRAEPATTAYLIYTSGTTGRPKAVAVGHSGLSNVLQTSLREMGWDGADRMPVLAAYTFDIFLFELLCPLLAGGTAVVFERRPALDLERLAPRAADFTRLHAVPALMRQLLELLAARGDAGPRRLRTVLVGGDAVPDALLADLLDAFPAAEVRELYGPSEGTIICSSYPVPRAARPVRSLIGRPLGNARLRLLGPHDAAVPLGSAGEIAIGGAGVAAGYLHQEELTAERFVTRLGERWYRTGDLARYLPSGDLEFLGRTDHQVKVRGFRVELGEIETVLAGHESVLEAVVLARAGRLFAFVVAIDVAAPSSGDLRGFLRERLPDYMVPSAVVTLEAWPLLPNGKVDRSALGRLAAPELAAGRSRFEAPRGPVEEVLAGIWADVLARDGETIGARDDFFELGGHSLLATRVISRVRQAFGVEVPVRALFEAPTVAGLAGAIERALGAGEGMEAPPIVPVERGGPLPGLPGSRVAGPLSFAQQRLWFLDRLEPGSPAYNLPTASRFGDLRVGELARALTEVVRRHEALRTVFRPFEDEPVQVILPPAPVSVPRVSLRALAAGDRAREERRLIRAEARRSFDLAHGPLLRARVLELDESSHTLLLNMHHIVSDGWSMGILDSELRHLADGLPPLQELPVQYADFAHWQRRWLSGEHLDAALGYWRRRLEGAPILELPTDRPRPPVQSHHGATCSRRLPEPLSRAVKRLALERGATTFMTLLAALQALLARVTGQEDLSVGTPIAGRGRLEVEGLIGFFVNTLVLRTDLSGRPGFAEVVARVREVALQAHGHQDLPFEKLVEELTPERSLSTSPLFQVMFSVAEGAEESAAPVELETAKFDLNLTVVESPKDLTCWLEYATALFDPTTVERLLRQLEALLAAAVEEPARTIWELPVLSGAERHQASVEWNDSSVAIDASVPVHRLFEAIAKSTPRSVAVAFEGQALTYGELDRRADHLAGALRRRGVGSGVPVGLFTDRTPDLVAAILGIWKAGGTFLPLDVDSPRPRLEMILEDAFAGVERPLVLAQPRFAADLPAGAFDVVLLEDLVREPPAAAPADVDPGAAAYLIYTSGTTGRPKAVAVGHRSLSNVLRANLRELGWGAGDRMPVLASYAFDIFLFELLCPLLAGGTAVLFERRPTLDLDRLPASVAGFTRLHAVPALMRQLLELLAGRDAGDGWPRMRTLFVGGDVVPDALLADLARAFPAAEVRELYGPTEGTIICSSYPVPRSAPVRSLIGRPLGNVHLRLSGRHGAAVPLGAAGEIEIGGAAPALGYLHRDELTRERFVESDGERWYRTGDLARYLPSGDLEFLGRSDHQVKVRGFRVELGEIEAVLAEHPRVLEAVALARGGRLVAYVTPAPVREDESPAAPEAGELLAFLREKLPDYMVPSAVAALAAWPLLRNGKVDRAALGRRALPETAGGAASFVAPRGPVEEVLAAIWSRVLTPPDAGRGVGAHDNFFELGGHSLLATRVTSRVRQAFGVEVPVRALFEAPTVAGLARRVERALTAGDGPEAPPIVPVPRGGPVRGLPGSRVAGPLSFAQQRLWFLDRLAPGSPAYNLPSASRYTGDLDLAVLARALSEVVRRHEALRTVFRAVDEEATQVILPAVAVRLPLVDLSALEAADREREEQRRLRAEARRPFDLEHGPLLRAGVLRLGETSHTVLLTAHHIVSDGWSTAILDAELRSLTEAFAAGEGSRLDELPVQYADFAHWQRRWLSGDTLAEALGYWRRRLDGAPVLELPTDRPRPPVQSQLGATCSRRLPEALTGALRRLALERGATPFMTLLAAFQVLLARLTGQVDVVVGTPIAGRGRLEIEGLIGFFVNTLVLRTDLSRRPGFAGAVERVREVVLQAHGQADVPFEKLVEELAPDRSLATSPLFQVMFSMAESTDASAAAVDSGTAKFDLTLTVVDAPRETTCLLEYSTALFDATTVRRFLGHFETLLAAAVEAPERAVWELPILAPGERHQLLEWNDSRRPAAGADAGGVHRRFEAQARRAGDAVAVVGAGGHLTYGMLDRRADGLAHRLHALGVGPEERVVLVMERSAAMAVAMLGVLKAGGAYVPVDPAYPAERVAFILEDTGARVLLTRERHLEDLPETPGRRLVVDRDLPHPGAAAGELPVTSGAHLAYVVYTSGSTGRPKGVEVSHDALLNLVDWHDRFYRLTPGDRASQVAGPAFDASVWEVWPYLATGGSVHVVDAATAVAAPEVVRWLATRAITRTFLPTPLAEATLAESWPAAMALRDLLTGGDKLHRGAPPGLPCRLINHYGPTENAVVTTATPVAAARPGDGDPPIGRPLDNVRVVLSGRGPEPVPAGVTGELQVSGSSLARGYLERPRQTAGAFVPDPFADAPGARSYKTGDLCRRRADGAIDFLGRADFQVKVRGFRIELGEIESALGGLPGVREAVVVARDGAGGATRLVAYVVRDRGEASDTRDLRAALERVLPSHMVPSAFVDLDALPLTPNGKVDRRALPEPSSTGLEATFVASRGPFEEVVAGIWSEVLASEGGSPVAIGAHDNFFELGGHSLLATRVVSRLRRAFGVEVPVRALFEAPTVAGLSRTVERTTQAGAGPEAPPVVPVPRGGSFAGLPGSRVAGPLSFAQQRLWFLDRLEPESSAYNLPTASRFGAELDVGVLARALTEVVRRHEALRTVFRTSDGEPVQVILPPAPVRLPVIDLAALETDVRAAEGRRLAREEARRPFDLARGPLLRACVVCPDAVSHTVLLNMHHIVSDGWSMEILDAELRGLTRAFAAGRAAPLPELPVQYADFAHWQRRWLEEVALEPELDYWRRKLAGAPPVLELPTDRPRPPVQSYRGTSRGLALPASVTAGLGRLARERGATTFMTLLAAFQVHLSRLTGRDDVSVGTPVAGRGRLEVEGLIGFFVNMLVLRTDLGGDPGFGDLLGRVREVVLEAHAHQDLPFEKLVEELEPERSLATSPLFQVMLTLQNATRRPVADSPEPAESTPEDEGGTIKYDLTLTLAEGPERLSGRVEYSTDLFDATTIARLCRHFGTLLAGIVEDPDRRLSELPLMAREERAQMLVEWNDTDGAGADLRCIQELFARQAERVPDAVAACDGGRTLTYRELARRARSLAHSLSGLGVAPEVRVGVCLERSLEMVTALLAVLGAGGAYVALDPAHPPERLAFILEDSEAQLLLSETRLRDRLPAAAPPAIWIDGGPIGAAKPADRAQPSRPENLAYVLYTSGSTGRPKGVAIEHRSAAALVRWARRTFPPADLERVLAVTSICFDLSVFELFVTLGHGGTVVLAPDALAIRELAERQRVTLVNTVPSAIAEVVRQGEIAPSVRAVNLAGEALKGSLVRQVYERGSVRRVRNLYGPSEDTTYSTAASIGRADAVPAVGRPIADGRGYVLGKRLRPVPMGATGELYLAGRGLARNYLERRALTAEKFIPDPFVRGSGGRAPGGRLYATGDRVRHRADGELEFLGRIDHQVKIRGFRIELGEIEAALAAHPEVREVAVQARDARLVAWLAPEKEATLVPDALRAHLRKSLPDYMVPSVFAVLDALPLNPNGKIDRERLARRALPDDRGDLPEALAAPRDLLEMRLARIFEQVLTVRPVGVRDNFFDLGGHSLAAVRLMTEIGRRLGRELPLSVLFEQATVEHLAQQLRDGAEGAAPSPLVAMQTAGSRRPLFCVHPAGGNVLSFLPLARALAPERPFYAFQSRGLEDDEAPHATVEAMAADYLAELEKVAPEGPVLLAGWSFGGLVAYEMAGQLERQGREAAGLVLLDTQAPAEGGAGDVDEALYDDDAFWLADVGDFLARVSGIAPSGRDLGLGYDDLRELAPAERLGRFVDGLRRVDFLPPESEGEEGALARVSRLLEVYKANSRAGAAYRGRPYGGGVTLLRAAETSETASPFRDDEDKADAPEPAPDFGWGRLAAGPVDVHTVPGDHVTLLARHNVAALAARIEACLAAGEEESGRDSVIDDADDAAARSAAAERNEE